MYIYKYDKYDKYVYINIYIYMYIYIYICIYIYTEKKFLAGGPELLELRYFCGQGS